MLVTHPQVQKTDESERIELIQSAGGSRERREGRKKVQRRVRQSCWDTLGGEVPDTRTN